MNDEILKLANDMRLVLCKSVTFAGGLGYGLQEDELEAFYRAAFNDGLRAAAARVEAWNTGENAAEAIRKMVKK